MRNARHEEANRETDQLVKKLALDRFLAVAGDSYLASQAIQRRSTPRECTGSLGLARHAESSTVSR
jgi:hypothetical protein